MTKLGINKVYLSIQELLIEVYVALFVIYPTEKQIKIIFFKIT